MTDLELSTALCHEIERSSSNARGHGLWAKLRGCAHNRIRGLKRMRLRLPVRIDIQCPVGWRECGVKKKAARET